MILVVGLVVVGKQLLPSWHLLSLLSVSTFVLKQKTNPAKTPTTLMVAFFPSDMYMALFPIFNYHTMSSLPKQLKCLCAPW